MLRLQIMRRHKPVSEHTRYESDSSRPSTRGVYERCSAAVRVCPFFLLPLIPLLLFVFVVSFPVISLSLLERRTHSPASTSATLRSSSRRLSLQPPLLPS